MMTRLFAWNRLLFRFRRRVGHELKPRTELFVHQTLDLLFRHPPVQHGTCAQIYMISVFFFSALWSLI